MPETSRPQPTRPADTRPPTRPGGSPPPSGPQSPTLPRPGRPRILGIFGLIAALAAIAVLADVCVMAAAWATTRNVYYIPDSNDWVYALVLLLFALWTGVSVILAPPRRKRRKNSQAERTSWQRRWLGLGSPVRSVRAAVSRGRGRSSTSGPATVPVSGRPGAVAPTSAPIPSPSWRSA